MVVWWCWDLAEAYGHVALRSVVIKFAKDVPSGYALRGRVLVHVVLPAADN